MSMTTDLIVNAMTSIYQGTPSAEQTEAMQTLAQAIIDTIKTATLNYTSGLTAPNGPVTGSMGTVTID